MLHKIGIKLVSLVFLAFFTITFLPISPKTANSEELSKKASIRLVDNRDKLKEMPVEVIKVNDYLYLPLKELCLFYNIKYKYDPITKGVSLEKGKKTVIIAPDKREFKIGKKKITMERPPVIVNWKMLVPPKGMAGILEEFFGCPVVWRLARNTFTVNDQEEVTFWEDHPEKIATTLTEKKKNLIRAGDTLLISVWQQGAFEFDELTREREVADDGTIKFPFIGRVRVYNLTCSQLEKKLSNKLKAYIKNPEVTVSNKSKHEEAFKIQVFGAVRKPGCYEFKERVTLMEVINMAGGFSDNAKLAKVRVTRFIHHSPYKTDVVNCKLILYEGQRQYDIPVENKDIVFVPKRRGFWGSLGGGISKISPLLTTTALIIGIIISARNL